MAISTSELVVTAKLKEIGTSHAGGPDGLPNWVLKEFAEILATPITDILNTSFCDCKVPYIWKIADYYFCLSTTESIYHL